MSRRAPPCSLLRPVGASRNPDQFSSLGNQFHGSIPLVNLGVIFDARLTWSAHIDQVRKTAAQRLGVLGPLLNGRSGLSTRNGVLLHKQLIRPMTDHACRV